MSTLPPRVPDSEADWGPLRDRLGRLQGREYWRSLEELSESPGFREALSRALPRHTAPLSGTLDRREFVTIAGAALALAGFSGCGRPPDEKIGPPHQGGRKPASSRESRRQRCHRPGVDLFSLGSRPVPGGDPGGNPVHVVRVLGSSCVGSRRSPCAEGRGVGHFDGRDPLAHPGRPARSPLGHPPRGPVDHV
jgi:MoCo/4Fe-4S cofactor protein with predicted Tat translocation signal